MSLIVTPELLDQAKEGRVTDAEFLACVSQSLPDAWELVSKLVAAQEASGAEFEDNRTILPDDVAAQLLRMMASTSMREAIERHFGVKLAFQNCHRVAVFRTGTDGTYSRFTSPVAQLLNQNPELVSC